jgi:hypothetical protein
VGIGGTILHTTNGGANWVSQSSGTTNSLLGVAFTDANTSTAVGDFGTILHTTNGGANWVSQSSGTTNHLSAVCFADANTVIAVGDFGTILRTTSAITGINDAYKGITNLPKNFLLEQNYPNPFNPKTTIHYQTPTNSTVILKVFDVLGREVTTLVNERQIAGSYSVKLDATALSSGIYFYRLQVGAFTQAKKLMLVR